MPKVKYRQQEWIYAHYKADLAKFNQLKIVSKHLV